MNLAYQEPIDYRIIPMACAFPHFEFFYCERGSCLMLKKRCEQRLKTASVRQKSLNRIESTDVHCIQCQQGLELTGLWVDAPHKVCMMHNCNNLVEAKGLCRLHYQRKMKNIKVKNCGKCGKELPLTSFYKCKNNRDGRQTMCRDCSKIEARKQTERNRRDQKVRNRPPIKQGF